MAIANVNTGDEIDESAAPDQKVDLSAYSDYKPIQEFMRYAQESGAKDQILEWSGKNNQNSDYAFDPAIVEDCWEHLLLFIFIYAAIAVLCLEFIDRDKR